LRRELGASVTCIAPDLPGFGQNRWQGEDYTLEALVDAMQPVVARESPTHVVGHSMGAIVALALAARHPGRFQRLGIIGLPVYEDRRRALAFLGGRGRVVRTFLRSDRLSHVACLGASATFPAWQQLARRRMPLYSRAILRSAFDHCGAAHGAFETIVFAGHAGELAAAVSDPVAVLHGEADRAAPISPVGRIAETRGWHLTVDPEANHQVLFQRPRFTADWIRERVLAPLRAAAAELPAAGA
jgi:pimeloyl-ACP methyl ester carboxylesterase